MSGPESPGRVAMRLRVEAKCAEVARLIGAECPPGHGFALFMFEYGEGGGMAYVSSGERESVSHAIEEWLGRQFGRPLAAENYALRERLEGMQALADLHAATICRMKAEAAASADIHLVERDAALARVAELEARLDPPPFLSDRGTPMFQIRTLIEKLQATEAQFGNTCVWFREASWGATALWALTYARDDALEALALRPTFAGPADHARPEFEHLERMWPGDPPRPGPRLRLVSVTNTKEPA